MNLEALRARLAEITTERRDMHKAAGEAAFTEEQEARWDALDGEEAEVRQDIAAAEVAEARKRRVEESRAKWGSTYVRTPVVEQHVDAMSLRGAELRDASLKRLDVASKDMDLRSDQLDQVDHLLRQERTRNYDPEVVRRRLLVTESPEYRSAFKKGAVQANPVFTPEEARALNEFRAMSIGTDAAGGYGLPVLIDPTIIHTGGGSIDPMRRISRQVNITTDAWKGVSSAGVSWSWDGEATEVSDDSPTLAQPTVTVYGARGFIPFSVEVAEDYPGFATEMSSLLVEGYDELTAAAFITGSTPIGILTALDANTNVEVVVTTDGTFTATDIDAVWSALPDRSKANATWLMSSDVDSYIGLWGDAYGGRTVDLTGRPTTLRGRPVEIATNMPSFTGTTGAANILVVGDFRNYLIVNRVGMSVELVPHLFGNTNGTPTSQRGWLARARVGADSINDLGFRLLQNQ